MGSSMPYWLQHSCGQRSGGLPALSVDTFDIQPMSGAARSSVAGTQTGDMAWKHLGQSQLVRPRQP